MTLPTHPALPSVIQSSGSHNNRQRYWPGCSAPLLSVTTTLPRSVTNHRQNWLLVLGFSTTSAQRLAQGSPIHISLLSELDAHIKVELPGSCPTSSCQTQHITDCKRRQTEQTEGWNLLFSNQSCCVGSILATGTQVCKNTEFSQLKTRQYKIFQYYLLEPLFR